MIISTCSFGSTGSSVITDYLKEFDNIQVMDAAELSWISDVDGIIDLDYHLNNPHNRTSDSIYAIERYKDLCRQKLYFFEKCGISKESVEKSVDEFLNTITMASWPWYNFPKETHQSIFKKIARRLINKTKFIPKWQTKTKRQWEGFPYSTISFSVKPQNFDYAVKKHINDLLLSSGAPKNKILVFDQLFPGNNPQACFKYFEDPYAIVVDRDPRDVYVFGRTQLLSKGDLGHIMPLNNVKDFITYYRALRDDQPYKEENERILRLRFEDLVYNYDIATRKIRDFLRLGSNPNPKTIFDPSLSIANTQVWKRFPNFMKDINYIEAELKEYLFDFADYPEPDKNAKMFSWKSPLNE